ncbi:MAG: Bug family tripartite tricarboxylate transporter substrate binding protein [Burkholderiales bacterium]
MSTLNRAAAVAWAVGFVCSMSSGAAHAAAKSPDTPENYPTKPVRIIAPFVPGGPTDIVARLVAQKMSDNTRQSVVVENRGGAGGSVGMQLAANSNPDGHTIVLGSSGNLAVNPALDPKLPYSTFRDFLPLTQTTSGPQILVVTNSLPVKTVQDLIALAKAKPGQLNYASGGAGTTTHLGPELFKLAAGINIVHVPYKGTGQALTDVMSGQVQMMMSSALPAIPHLKAGRLRGLGVTSAKRAAAYPELPTLAESGLPGFETTSWHGMLVPAKTPRATAQRVHAELVKALTAPDIKDKFAGLGMEVVASRPEEFASYIKSENAKWTKVIKAIGLKPEGSAN